VFEWSAHYILQVRRSSGQHIVLLHVIVITAGLAIPSMLHLHGCCSVHLFLGWPTFLLPAGQYSKR